MAVKKINSAYVPEELKILKTPCEPVVLITEVEEALITDLIDTAEAHPGCIGLTANQIWENPDVPAPAIFIIPGAGKKWAVCINPVIEMAWKKTIKAEEACMSIPRFKKTVERPRHISVAYSDGTGASQKEIHLFDMMGRIFLHEFDHIQGKLINE